MFRIDASILRECVEAVLAVVDEARLKIGKEGWKVRAVDPANVALVDLELRREAFSEFSLGPEKEQKRGEKEFVVGVPFDKMRDVLRWCKGDVALSMEKEKMTLQSDAYTFTLTLIDPSSIRKEPKIPEIEFAAKVVVDANDFKKVLKAAEKVSYQVAIGVQNGFFVEAEGEMETMRYSLHKDELVHLSGSDCRSLFSLEYLTAMAKGFASDTLTLHISTDHPLKIEFDIADGNGKVVYMLAPRIEAE